MTKRRWLVTGLVMLAVLLAACGGGEEKEGVELQVAGGSTAPTPTPTAEPTPDDAAGTDAAVPDDLAGSLLILRGGTFELLDLAGNETTVFEGPRSFSPAFFNPAGTHAAYTAFPDFGVLDLQAGAIVTVQNRGSNPNGFAISPDGAWLAIFTGQFTNRLQVSAVGGTEMHNVAASSETNFGTVWTSDSKLVWWENAPEPVFQVFDPVTGESAPLEDNDLEVLAPLPTSPDGMRAANVPIAFRPDNPEANPDACFDSYVELYDLPFTLDDVVGEGETVWTERGLVASSPQWLDDERLLFVKVGTGQCGDVQGDAERMVMLFDTAAAAAEPVAVAGPLGNADDPNDRPQAFGKVYGHLYAPSPDGRYIAWIGGGLEARESTINITEIETGATFTLLRTTREEAGDAASFIEGQLFRQVVWLE